MYSPPRITQSRLQHILGRGKVRAIAPTMGGMKKRLQMHTDGL
ncbi:hypothetical protein [Fischerella thermalis]|nr:hypothetical protein [Fischerella thermalis]